MVIFKNMYLNHRVYPHKSTVSYYLTCGCFGSVPAIWEMDLCSYHSQMKERLHFICYAGTVICLLTYQRCCRLAFLSTAEKPSKRRRFTSRPVWVGLTVFLHIQVVTRHYRVYDLCLERVTTVCCADVRLCQHTASWCSKRTVRWLPSVSGSCTQTLSVVPLVPQWALL